MDDTSHSIYFINSLSFMLVYISKCRALCQFRLSTDFEKFILIKLLNPTFWSLSSPTFVPTNSSYRRRVTGPTSVFRIELWKSSPF